MVRLATRPSRLAQAQAELARTFLTSALPNLEVEVIPIHSEGDLRQSQPLREFGDKAVFVTAVEEAVRVGQADIAVHSLKDMPLTMGPYVTLAAVLTRADPRDVLISNSGADLLRLSEQARVGTGSARRVLQLQRVRPDLSFVDIRGNVETRLRKLENGEYDAIVLAAAGLDRLGLIDSVSQYLEPDVCTPAPGQGVIALQCRSDSELVSVLSRLSDANAHVEATIERDVGAAVGATCSTPFGCLARVDTQSGAVAAQAWLARSEPGQEPRECRVDVSAPSTDWESLAPIIANRLIPA